MGTISVQLKEQDYVNQSGQMTRDEAGWGLFRLDGPGQWLRAACQFTTTVTGGGGVSSAVVVTRKR